MGAFKGPVGVRTLTALARLWDRVTVMYGFDMPAALTSFPSLARLLPFAVAAFAASASAQQASAPAPAGPAVYLQLSAAENNTRAVQGGLTWDWNPSWHKGYWDLGLAQWRADTPTGRDSITVLSFIPTFRFQPWGEGSAWFVDAGLGGTWANDKYLTTEKRFGTRFNFASQVGIGMRFGDQQAHELGLRVQHVSNGGYKKPNPGENFIQLRYAVRF